MPPKSPRQSFDDFRDALHAELIGLTTRELAIYFSRGQVGGGYDPSTESVEAKRIIVRDYLSTKDEAFRAEFEEHLRDPLLGELETDLD